MLDKLNRELEIGDKVGFVVGNDILTGEVVEIKRINQAREKARIKLDVPETSHRNYRMENGLWTHDRIAILHRFVEYSSKVIIINKGLAISSS